MEGWTTESVLKKHNLWRELAGPLAGPTAITLQWQDMRIAKLEAALTLLTNGFKYSTEVVTIARTALATQAETACELCEGSGETGVTHSDGTQYSTKTPPCAECGGSGLTMQPGMPDGEPEGLPCPKCKSKQFAPIGNGTICSNCTKTIGYHHQTAEGDLFCEVPKETAGKPTIKERTEHHPRCHTVQYGSGDRQCDCGFTTDRGSKP